MRIRNRDRLVSHGNIEGRNIALEILEAGLFATDPYQNVKSILRLEGDKLFVGNDDFVPTDSPRKGTDVYRLGEDINRIFLIGAGKGIQRVAQAVEDVLGEYLTAGFVILKHKDSHSLKRIKVKYGGHPLPDEDSVRSSMALKQMIGDIGLTNKDLVITIIGNGASSLMTLPVNDIPLEEVASVTRILQIEMGLPTSQVNLVRNQIDQLKGGRVTRLLVPAKMLHFVAVDLEEPNALGKSGYDGCVNANFWIHTLPDMSSPEKSVMLLRQKNAWEKIGKSIQKHLIEAKSSNSVLSAGEFDQMDARIFGLMPTVHNFIPRIIEASRIRGFEAHFLARRTFVEATAAGALIGRIAINVAEESVPFKTPCVLFLTGEMIVTVGKDAGVGGRNQEFSLSAARVISGNSKIVIAAIDTDGTDGPGGYINEDAESVECNCLSGGIVDGFTMVEASEIGVDIDLSLDKHSTSDALWKLDCGIWATQGISLQDIIVVIVQ